MLYANVYVRLPDGRGASSQIYLASFPKTATDIPGAFERKLSEATAGRPERYLALYQRIETEVLLPARARQCLEAAAQQRRALAGALHRVVRGLKDIPNMPGYPSDTTAAEFQDLLPELQASADRVLQARHQPNTSPVEPIETPEQRLQRLLSAANVACAEIAELMPDASESFRRGYCFEPETQNAVQQLWFRTSDAVAALSARRQLRRPRNWSRLRESVMTSEQK